MSRRSGPPKVPSARRSRRASSDTRPHLERRSIRRTAFRSPPIDTTSGSSGPGGRGGGGERARDPALHPNLGRVGRTDEGRDRGRDAVWRSGAKVERLGARPEPPAHLCARARSPGGNTTGTEARARRGTCVHPQGGVKEPDFQRECASRSARAWTRVPHSSFPRNEGVPGSSPGVGLPVFAGLSSSGLGSSDPVSGTKRVRELRLASLARRISSSADFVLTLRFGPAVVPAFAAVHHGSCRGVPASRPARRASRRGVDVLRGAPRDAGGARSAQARHGAERCEVP